MFDRLDAEILATLRGVTSGSVGHFLRDGFLTTDIQPLHRPAKLVGQAVTVSSAPTDHRWIMKAIEQASPGDVLVIDRQGDTRHACWGGVMTLMAQRRGLAGVVIDGAATDWKQVGELAFPVFCRHLSALTTRDLGLAGSVGESVACGGLTVQPGDVVLGDEDGVVVIPHARAAAVAEQGNAWEQREKRLMTALKSGLSPAEAQAAADAQAAVDAE